MKLMKCLRRLFTRDGRPTGEPGHGRAVTGPSFFATTRDWPMRLLTPFQPVSKACQDPAFMDTRPGVASLKTKG
jgi:hypothetical protein